MRGALITKKGMFHLPADSSVFVSCISFTQVAVVRQSMETADICRLCSVVIHIMTALVMDGIGNGAV